MAKRRILLTGAGGTPSINFTRSLSLHDDEFSLVGVDCNKYYLQRAETDEKYLVPPLDDPDYLGVLNHYIEQTWSQARLDRTHATLIRGG